jgi:hypothetical protein
VRYADFLVQTVGEWKKHGTVVVITREDDVTTHQVCRDAGVRFVTTGAWYQRSPDGINKGSAQDTVIANITKPGEPIAVFDADCFPMGRLPEHPGATDLLYGCNRYDCKTIEDFNQKRITPPEFLKPAPIGSIRPHLVRGFFQQFIYTDQIHFANIRHSAFSGCDMYLASQFARNHRVEPSEFYVLHLGQRQMNWRGRVTEKWQ